MLKKYTLLSFIALVLSFTVEAQNGVDVFRTSETFYNTTYVGFDLVKKKDVKIEVFDVKKDKSFYKRVIKNKESVGFKLYLGELKKGDYLMVFSDNEGNILKEFKIKKIK